MSWKTDAEKRFKYIAKARQELQKTLRRFNMSVYSAAIDRFFGLNTGGGKIITSVYNITHANQTGLIVATKVQEENRSLIRELIGGMLKLFGLNTKYFGAMSDITTIEPTAREKIFLSYGYDIASGNLIPGGYLYNSLASNPAAAQVVKLMNDAINAQMTLPEFQRLFKQFFQPVGSSGYIERHFMRWSYDFYQQFDRLSQLEYKNALGYEYGIYAGTLVDDSRDFCEQRNNFLYTEAEIVSWNKDTWQGKIPRQDVRTACGGYNCRHSINWISDELAATLIKRGMKLNEYR